MGERFIGQPPTPQERADLSARLEQLDQALEHRDRRQIERALAALFAVTKLPAEDRRNAAALISDYAPFFDDLPAWAVAEACLRLGRGEGESRAFAPAAPEIHRCAERLVFPLRGEAKAEERARIAEKVRKLCAVLDQTISELRSTRQRFR
jgi:hypothetical protein